MQAASVESYLSQPVGRYVAGPTFVVWWKSAKLNGVALWGRLEEEHVRSIAQALEAELSPSVVPHASLIDARRLCGGSVAAFNALLTHIDARREVLARTLERQAVVRPDGFAGAAIAGFFCLLTPSYPVALHTDPEVALGWLGLQNERSIEGEIDALVRDCDGTPDVVFTLRAYFERSLGSASIACASNALHVSVRTLQRQLHDAGTSFRAELDQARVRRAKRLIADSTLDFKQVARHVGCGSAQSFSSLFKRIDGQSPSRYRAGDRDGKRTKTRRA